MTQKLGFLKGNERQSRTSSFCSNWFSAKTTFIGSTQNKDTFHKLPTFSREHLDGPEGNPDAGLKIDFRKVNSTLGFGEIVACSRHLTRVNNFQPHTSDDDF